MGRPLKANTPAAHRVQALLTDSELEALDGWRFGHRVGSRSEAIRQLLALGLAADAAGWTPDAPKAKASSKAATRKTSARKGGA